MVTRESAASSAPDCAGRNGAHTPGPWKTNGVLVEAAQMALSVCTPYPPGIGYAPKDDDEWRANARLIAAAPDLATSASAAERKLVELRALLADNGISCPCTDEIVQLQDALIKAGV